MKKCENCNTNTTNPRFCSRRCSAQVTNKEHPRRKKKVGHCKKCEKEIRYTSAYCFEHKSLRSNRTLGYIHGLLSSKGHASWKNAYVRQHCRDQNSRRIKVCENCGYDKHVEFCHIKPLADFPDIATLAEVNSEDNVAILCRNCHWEFDHGLLFLSPRTEAVS